MTMNRRTFFYSLFVAPLLRVFRPPNAGLVSLNISSCAVAIAVQLEYVRPEIEALVLRQGALWKRIAARTMEAERVFIESYLNTIRQESSVEAWRTFDEYMRL